VNFLSKQIKPAWPVFALSVTVLFCLTCGSRFYNLTGINNYIDDLSARQAILSLDIMKGICHFPHSPWLFEFDEPGLAYLTVPLLHILGTDWIVYQVFTAATGSLVCLALFCFSSFTFGFPCGFASALILATLPCMITWDRYYYMGGSEWINLLIIASLSCLLIPADLNKKTVILSGVLIGLTGYIAGTAALIFPTLLAVLFVRVFRTSPGGIFKFLNLAFLQVSSYLLITLPVTIMLISEPYYLLWRKQHFIDVNKGVLWAVTQYLSNVSHILMEIFWSAENFLHQPLDLPLILWPAGMFIVIGFLRICSTWKTPGSAAVLMFSLTWVSLAGTLKAEPWRGAYFCYIMPFLCMTAGRGISWIVYELEWGFIHKKWKPLVFTGIMIMISAQHIYECFHGRYQLAFRPDILTRLQQDLTPKPDAPYLFSSRIPDIHHYHFPFWFVSRSRLEKVAIFDWKNDTWIRHPDNQKSSLVPEPESKVYIVLRQEDKSSFINLAGQENVFSVKNLTRSSLIALGCSLELDDVFKETWTESAIPPMLQDISGKPR